VEDHRADLVLIVAGYTSEMGEILTANPGLASRLPTTITFEDYSASELLQILQRIAADNDYSIGADPRLIEAITASMAEPAFGNAREMRNLFEAAVRRQAWRLREISDVSVDQMRILTVDDVLP